MANTVHGRDGRLYLSDGASAAAVRVLNARGWKFTIDKAEDEDNALGDSWETHLVGLLKFQGSMQGNMDTADAGAQRVWSSATATTKTYFYFYPAATSTARYYYGYCHLKLSVDLSLANTVRWDADFVGDGALSQN